MERFSSFDKKKVYNGLDVLKFALALIVVAIHVKPFAASPVIYKIASPLLSSAVPLFFLITSFLFFKKYNISEPPKKRTVLLGYLKRIGILYLVWFVIDFVYIYIRKDYFHIEGLSMGSVFYCIGQLVKDVIFATTFPGSWFLSSSVVALLLVCLLSDYLGCLISFIVSLLLSIYLYIHDSLPLILQAPYDYYAGTFREEVNLSFPFAMVWISMGAVLAKESYYSQWVVCYHKYKSFFTFMVAFCYIMLFMDFWYICYLFVPICFIIASFADIKDRDTCRYLRNASILVFFSHFWIAGKKDLFFNVIGAESSFLHILYYLIVVVVCCCFAFAVLSLEKQRRFSFLRLLH